MQAAEREIEEHVAEHNCFFQLIHFILDDSAVYTDAVLPALRDVCSQTITDQQASEVILKAMADARAIDKALELENAAQIG